MSCRTNRARDRPRSWASASSCSDIRSVRRMVNLATPATCTALAFASRQPSGSQLPNCPFHTRPYPAVCPGHGGGLRPSPTPVLASTELAQGFAHVCFGHAQPLCAKLPMPGVGHGRGGTHPNEGQLADARSGRNPLPALRCTHRRGPHRRACLRGSLPLRRPAPGRSRRTPPDRRALGKPSPGGAQRSPSLRRGSIAARASAPTIAPRPAPLS
jgi:hypothetical protein